jgi:hypothetical protein
MHWLDRQVSFYSTHADNIGRPATYRDILLTEFERDISTIIALRKLDKDAPGYEPAKKDLKAKLQCFTPAALLATKAKGQLKEIHRTGIMQLDFDYKDIQDYDVEELKRCVFDLPFVAFCGLSVSGDGFYALALIDEPERLNEYAEHCFEVLESYGIKADTSKGKKPENLRYVSYDANMLIKDNPTPLRIKQFKAKKKPLPPKAVAAAGKVIEAQDNRLLVTGLNMIAGAEVGNRWQTVQKWAYTLGGIGDPSVISQIRDTINHAGQFAGMEDKYIQCAEVCFKAGTQKPI